MIDSEEIKKIAVTKYEVKRYVETFINKFKGSISLIDKDQEVYRMYLPQILRAEIKKLDREGHPSLHGVIFIFKIDAKDRKRRPRKAQIVSIISDGEKANFIDLREIWNFDLRDRLDQEISKNKEEECADFMKKGYGYADNAVEMVENNLKTNTEQSLHSLASKIKQT